MGLDNKLWKYSYSHQLKIFLPQKTQNNAKKQDDFLFALFASFAAKYFFNLFI